MADGQRRVGQSGEAVARAAPQPHASAVGAVGVTAVVAGWRVMAGEGNSEGGGKTRGL